MIKQIQCIVWFAAASLCAASLVSGEMVMPQMGGGLEAMSPETPMLHVNISQVGSTLVASDPAITPVLRDLPEGIGFMPGDWTPALDDQHYNFQYGWRAEGAISVPADAKVLIKLLSKSDGLNCYAGGMRMGSPYGDYAPVLSSVGDVWEFDGAMTHHTYAVLNPTQEHYFASYEIFFADQSNVPVPGYTSAFVTLDFDVVPEPASLSLLSGAVWVWLRKRRRC